MTSSLREIGRVGVWSHELRFHPDRGAAKDAAAELEALGYAALFIPDVGGDVLGACAEMLEATRSIPVVTGILNIWMHDPQAVAEGFAELDARHPGRLIIGLGASHASIVDEAAGEQRYERPLSVMRTYLDALDAADPPLPGSARILAALGPKMLALSGERSAGAHPYLVPVEHTRVAREILGGEGWLAPEQPVVLAADRDVARAHVAEYFELPNYVANLRRLGYGDADFADGGSNRVVDDLVAWGDEDTIAQRVLAQLDAGADHVCIQVIDATDEVLPRDRWRRLATTLRNL